MKIYCIMFDSMPANKELEIAANKLNINFIKQISCCFTMTSTISLWTGQLPSDLEDAGVGWRTHEKYRLYPPGKFVQNEEVIKWPWINRTLFNILFNLGWNIRIHNAEHFRQYMTNTNQFNFTTSYPGGQQLEVERGWSRPEIKEKLCSRGDKRQEHFEEEKKWINRIQAEAKDNTLYFITYNHYHDWVGTNYSENDVVSNIIDIINSWNFEEEDAIFWLFSDHGDYSKCDIIPILPDFCTWTLYRDNTKTPIKINGSIISISDFYSIIRNKVEYNKNEFTSNKDRIYFVEDGRDWIDSNQSTTATAIQFTEWNDNVPTRAIQTTYFLITNQFVSYAYDLKNIKMVPIETNKYKEDLAKRFKWVKWKQ